MTDFNNTAVALTSNQLDQIKAFGEAKNYAAMYRYISNEIIAGRIQNVPQGQAYWFQQAANINQNNTKSPATVYIREVTRLGLNINSNDPRVQTISNSIGLAVYESIRSSSSIPSFGNQIKSDISGAIDFGGMTIGGWGGAFYYWDAPFTNPSTGLTTTVGSYILSNPAEYNKFLDVNSQAVVNTVKQLGIGVLANDPDGFLQAMSTGLKNFALKNPVVGIELQSRILSKVTGLSSEEVKAVEVYLIAINNNRVVA